MHSILEPADRPLAVSWFEWLSLSLLVYNCIGEAPWPAVLAYVLFTLWMVLAISRHRSAVSRWLLTAINAIFYAVLIVRLAKDDAILRSAAETEPMEWVLGVLNLTTLGLLWSHPMSSCTASRPKAETSFPV